MSGAVLVLNAGSSSIKFVLFPADQRPARGNLICEGAYDGLRHRVHFSAKDGTGSPLVNEDLPEITTHEEVVAALLGWLGARFPDRELAAAGHRVVHGGTRYDGPVLIDEKVIEELTRLVPLAPLHQPHHLSAIAANGRFHPRTAAGGLLRHLLPPYPAGDCWPICVAAQPDRGRNPALWFPWSFL